LEVPNVKELKPILINRGRLLGKTKWKSYVTNR
jgi:hypothetical protein